MHKPVHRWKRRTAVKTFGVLKEHRMTKQSAGFSHRLRTATRRRTTASAMVALTAITAVTMLLSAPVRAQDDELPKIDEMMQQIPSFKDLMDAAESGDEVDWIVLKDDRVIVSTPVYPRPDTLKKIEAGQVECICVCC